MSHNTTLSLTKLYSNTTKLLPKFPRGGGGQMADMFTSRLCLWIDINMFLQKESKTVCCKWQFKMSVNRNSGLTFGASLRWLLKGLQVFGYFAISEFNIITFTSEPFAEPALSRVMGSIPAVNVLECTH